MTEAQNHVQDDSVKRKEIREADGRPCPKCGHVNSPQSNFCRKCGASLKEEEQQKRTDKAPAAIVCASCGAGNKRGSSFCRSCGAALASAGRSGKSAGEDKTEKAASGEENRPLPGPVHSAPAESGGRQKTGPRSGKRASLSSLTETDISSASEDQKPGVKAVETAAFGKRSRHEWNASGAAAGEKAAGTGQKTPEPEDDKGAPKSAFAQGFPEWTLEPPMAVSRAKRSRAKRRGR